MTSHALTWDDVCALALSLPDVEIGETYGTPALKVRAKFMGRLKEDGETMVLKVPFVVRDHLMATQPALFFITDHYIGYPAVLFRLASIPDVLLADLLEEAWLLAAPPSLRKQTGPL